VERGEGGKTAPALQPGERKREHSSFAENAVASRGRRGQGCDRRERSGFTVSRGKKKRVPNALTIDGKISVCKRGKVGRALEGKKRKALLRKKEF